jgi:hypothetical protein
MSVRRSGTLYIELNEQAATPTPVDETALRNILHQGGFSIHNWNARYIGHSLSSLSCDLHWTDEGKAGPSTPVAVRELTFSSSITTLTWKA